MSEAPLPPSAGRVLKALAKGEASYDELVVRVRPMDPGALLATLYLLESRGLIDLSNHDSVAEINDTGREAAQAMTNQSTLRVSKSRPLIPKEWAGSDGRDYQYLQIEHDRFDADEPFVVTLFGRDKEDGKAENFLFCATPKQAREMAAALLVYAHMAEQATERVPSESSGASDDLDAPK